MEILTVRNVHEALPRAVQFLYAEGVTRGSRNGPVMIGPSVTTVYEKPLERVLYWPARDANPFFHLYESLWMLAGRQDVAGPAHYAKQINEYSDDGVTLHGAYGYRWRKAFGVDQLGVIADRLKKNPEDRRCMLQMWDAAQDLGANGRDVPCNTTATFQRDADGKLDMTVFCRSNDIVWGAYGANAVHFGYLLEYMALWIGCPVGTYTQVSVNWHGYLSTLEKVKSIQADRIGYLSNPYTSGAVAPTPVDGTVKEVDEWIRYILTAADKRILYQPILRPRTQSPWVLTVYLVLEAYEHYRENEGQAKYLTSLAVLLEGNPKDDWIVAAKEWITRRYERWQEKA